MKGAQYENITEETRNSIEWERQGTPRHELGGLRGFTIGRPSRGGSRFNENNENQRQKLDKDIQR